MSSRRTLGKEITYNLKSGHWKIFKKKKKKNEIRKLSGVFQKVFSYTYTYKVSYI